MSMSDPILTKLKVETITPVSIGGDKGAQLSPYAHYVFSEDGRTLYYLNLNKIEQAVEEKNAIDDYIQAIRSSINNNRSEFDLEDFISKRLKGNIADFIARKVPQHGIRPGQRAPVTPVVKNGLDPYLPGSSIKGALRTAIMYQWLLSDEGFPFLQSYADSVDKFRHLRDTWFNLKKSRADFREIKAVESEMKKYNRAVFNEDDLFGSLREGPEARFLRVRDTDVVRGADALEVQALKRIRIVPGEGKSVIPQIVEAIPAGKTLHTELSIIPGFREKSLQYLNSGKREKIFQCINRFSLACIENEIQEIGSALEAKELPANVKELEKLLGFYQNLQERAAQGEVFLRLGFGKTVNDNSLLLAFLNGLNSKKAWHDMRVAYHKMRRETAFYPVTRSVTSNGLPMGWVKIK